MYSLSSCMIILICHQGIYRLFATTAIFITHLITKPLCRVSLCIIMALVHLQLSMSPLLQGYTVNPGYSDSLGFNSKYGAISILNLSALHFCANLRPFDV